jgi:hypothetical protein
LRQSKSTANGFPAAMAGLANSITMDSNNTILFMDQFTSYLDWKIL